jgi:hypothetical protein
MGALPACLTDINSIEYKLIEVLREKRSRGFDYTAIIISGGVKVKWISMKK